MNGVTERRNKMLKEMIWSMITYSTLLESLWGKALKTLACLLNRVPTKATEKCPYELWTGKKPSLKHLNIRGCLAEPRPYKLNEKKLDARTISCYFIGYSERSKGYRFYDPTIRSIFDMGNAQFFENVEFARGDKVRDFLFEEECVNILIVVINNDQTSIHDIIQEANLDQDNVEEPPIQNQEIVSEEQILHPEEPMLLRRSTRERRSGVPNDYIIFLQEHEVDIGMAEDDLINFHQAMEISNSQK